MARKQATAGMLDMVHPVESRCLWGLFGVKMKSRYSGLFPKSAGLRNAHVNGKEQAERDWLA